ncbi:MAG: hypothetical protein ACI90S_001408, partial [Marinobacter psychrophilus]
KAGQKIRRESVQCAGGSEEHEALKAFFERYFRTIVSKSVFSAFHFHY